MVNLQVMTKVSAQNMSKSISLRETQFWLETCAEFSWKTFRKLPYMGFFNNDFLILCMKTSCISHSNVLWPKISQCFVSNHSKARSIDRKNCAQVWSTASLCRHVGKPSEVSGAQNYTHGEGGLYWTHSPRALRPDLPFELHLWPIVAM